MRRLLPTLFVLGPACSRGEDTAIELAPCVLTAAPSALFQVQQVEEEEGWEVHVSGQVFDGPIPRWQTTVLESEHCRYGYYLPTTCQPECDRGSYCVDGDCLGWPEGISGGTLQVDGVGERLVLAMEDARPGHYHESVELPFDAFDEGSPVRFATSGDQFPAVRLAARGVRRIETPAAERGLSWTHGQEVTLTWDAGGDPEACVSVELYTQSYGHGTPIANLLECVGPDTGSFTFPVEFVDLFPEYDTPGVCAGTDCPYPQIRRFTSQIISTAAGDAGLMVWTDDRFPLEAGS
ncbi:MAG: hypothetical protein ABIO70_22795 [Pseudomonadota bacterium]